jgi:hypothetical protein
MNTTTAEETAGTDSDVATSVVVGILTICFYVIGMYLHTKIIIICKKEKQVTWKLDITNSISLMVAFTYNILLHFATYMIPDLYLVTGEWFCYASKVIIHFAMLYNIGHSMVISLMKYVVIVHDETIRPYKEKVLNLFFWINILHPLIGIILQVVVIPEFYVVYSRFQHINTCLGNPQLNKTKLFSVCDIIEPPTEDDTLANSIYIIRWLVCNLLSIFFYMVAFNIFDVVIYCKIFAYGRRQETLIPYIYILPKYNIIFYCFNPKLQSTYFLYFFSRKILPRNNNVAAKMLSKDANEINAKILLVSSQVTAMVTFLEVAYTIVYIVVIGIIVQKTSFGTLTQNMGLFFVVLPYSYLMNTSHNRHRIVDLGWKNILKNIFGCRNNSIANSNNDFITCNTNKKTVEKNDSKKKDNSGTKNKISNKQNKPNGNWENDRVFVIRTPVEQENDAVLEADHNNGCLFDSLHNPGTSYGIKSQGRECRLRTIRPSSRYSEEDFSEDKEKREFVQGILCNMISNIEDELLYIQYFQVLLNVEKYFKNGKSTSEYNLLNASNNTSNIGNSHKSKKGKTNAHDTGVILSIGNDYCISSCGKKHQGNNDFITPSFKGDKTDRTILREELLNKIVAIYNNDDEYNVLFEQMVDLEESFVQELLV